MAAQQYSTDTEGNRIIEGSRRPDGSLRKEIKVRPGYVPQDEQAKFTATGARARQGAQRVPGMDNAEVDGLKDAAQRSRPPRRRPKKPAEPAQPAAAQSSLTSASASAPPRPSGRAPAEAAAADLGRLRLDANGAHQPDGSSEPAAAGADAEKQARALRKKVLACEALAGRQAAGDALTGPELDKLAKAAGWQQELAQLEAGQTA